MTIKPIPYLHSCKNTKEYVTYFFGTMIWKKKGFEFGKFPETSNIKDWCDNSMKNSNNYKYI